VLRLLDEGNKVFNLHKVGFMPRDVERVQSIIDKQLTVLGLARIQLRNS